MVFLAPHVDVGGVGGDLGAENQPFCNGELSWGKAQNMTDLDGTSRELDVARFDALSKQNVIDIGFYSQRAVHLDLGMNQGTRHQKKQNQKKTEAHVQGIGECGATFER